MSRLLAWALAACALAAGCAAPDAPPNVTVTVTKTVTESPDETFAAEPSIAFSPDEAADKISVLSASSNADWSRIRVSIESCTGPSAARAWVGGEGAGASHVSRPGRVAASSQPLLAAGANCAGTPSPEQSSPNADHVEAADYLQFCGAGSVTNVKVRLTDTVANAIVHVHTFTDITNCT